MAAELVWVTGLLTRLAWTWPEPPWRVLLIGGGVLMLVLRLLCYPFSKTLFLAFDLRCHPTAETERQ
mgnify:FL=1